MVQRRFPVEAAVNSAVAPLGVRSSGSAAALSMRRSTRWDCLVGSLACTSIFRAFQSDGFARSFAERELISCEGHKMESKCDEHVRTQHEVESRICM